VVAELLVNSGVYIDMFTIPFEQEGWTLEKLNACGISPVDSIMYCALLAEGDSHYFLVRIDETAVEFVLKLPFRRGKNANAGAFSGSGVFFVAEHTGLTMIVQGVDTIEGVAADQRTSAADNSSVELLRPEHLFQVNDFVVASVDLLDNGPEDFVFSIGSGELQVLQYNPDSNQFSKGWKFTVIPWRWDRYYGAGWNFQNQVVFSENSGKGVYQVPLDMLKVIMMASSTERYKPDTKVSLKKIGESVVDEADDYDGLNCMGASNPWVTEVGLFDCQPSPVPQKTIMRERSAVALLESHAKTYTKIYEHISAFAISPLDSLVYAALIIEGGKSQYISMMEEREDPELIEVVEAEPTQPLPEPFYIVRLDSKVMEFVAKVQPAAGRPSAATFDPTGDYYLVSDGTLFRFAQLENMKGYQSPMDDDLPFFTMDSSAVVVEDLAGLNQTSDIVAIPGNFDKEGAATWVLGVNASSSIFAFKVTGNESAMHIVPIVQPSSMSSKLEPPLRAWSSDSEMYITSGDHVYQVPADSLKVSIRNGSIATLEKVEEEDPVWDDSRFTCFFSSSLFSGNGRGHVQHRGADLIEELAFEKENSSATDSWEQYAEQFRAWYSQ